MPPILKTSDNLLKIAPNIPETEFKEKEDKLLIMKPVYQNINQVDLWENADRQTNNNADVTKYEGIKKQTNTLKEALKNRPPVADFIEQITKANEEDMEKRKQRERDKMYNVYFPYDNTEAKTGEKEADEIFRKILNVDQASSPTSLPISRGRMVGFGKQSQQRKRNIKDSQTSHQQR